MRQIEARTASASYRICVGVGILGDVQRLLASGGLPHRCVVVTDSTTRRFYGAALEQSLGLAGLESVVLQVADGESSKSLETAARLYKELDAVRAERSTPILALGGGVVGDLAGFVAATYLRGLPLVHLPTTLLAQVDSSIGGKVAVNHGGLKNKIGAFYQPTLVISDVGALPTLRSGEFTSGLAEVVKTAMVRDAALFEYLEHHLEELTARRLEVLEEVVARCAQIKAEVVEQDERDLGIRNILNYGHTVGHALETVSGFGLSHGQAVAIGMVVAARVAQAIGLLDSHQLERIRRMVAGAGLPDTAQGFDKDVIIGVMQHDKKVIDGRLRFVLPTSIGEACVTDGVPLHVLESVLGGGAV